MLHCPACGVEIADLYDARRMVDTQVKHGRHGAPDGIVRDWETVVQRPERTGCVVVQPCGCVLSRRLADALRS